MTGMGGGAVDRRGHVHTTSTQNGITTGERYSVHTSSLYPSSRPNMNFFTPFGNGNGEGFHQGPLGVPSHGCIHLSRDNARTILENAPPGVPVHVDATAPPGRNHSPAAPHHGSHPAPHHANPAPPANSHPGRPHPSRPAHPAPTH
jgi:hypothetical protein